MNDAPETVTTDSTPGEEQFEQTASEALDRYQDYLYGRGQYYGPAMDGSLRGAVRAALASGRLSPMTLYGQFGEPDFDREVPDADGLREAIEECSANERREMWERVGDSATFHTER